MRKRKLKSVCSFQTLKQVNSVVAAVSAARSVQMQAARLPLQQKIYGRGSRLVNPRREARERKGSAVRLIQRMNARRAVPCRETMMPARWIKAQLARTLHREDRHPKNLRRRAPNVSFSQEQQRAGFCSIAPARFAVFALLGWNETGTRLAPIRFLLQAPRTRNDWRSRSRNKLQSRRPPNAYSLSCSMSALECTDTSAL